MNKQAVFHEVKSRYSYIYKDGKLHLRLRAAKDDVKNVKILTFDPYKIFKPDPENPENWLFSLDGMEEIEMVKEHTNELFDYWFAELNTETLRVRYGFLMDSDEGEYFYGALRLCKKEEFDKVKEDWKEYFNFPFMNSEDIYKAPEWVKDTVWYQIFMDRFCNGNPDDDRKKLPWKSVEEYSNSHRFGGNLQGVISKLDYIQEFGFNGIYFTPLFVSESTHNYDIEDYYNIDPMYGSNVIFGELIKEAHSRGIKVMLDAVFNHCSWKHPFWQDVLKNGKESKYYDYFHILDEAKPVMGFSMDKAMRYELTYEEMININFRAFGYEVRMPKWNHGNPEVSKYLLDVAKFWIEKYDIDGWRLDVSNEVPHGFWREFRKVVKAAKPDAYIVGENWEGYYPWLQGDQFDSVMNYELMYILWHFIGEKYITEKVGVKKFTETLGNYFVAYPKYIMPYMFNMIDSHDTARVIEFADSDMNKAKLVYVLQMIMPGSPSIYYGSEIGLEGVFESNRQCMNWDNPQDHELYKHIKELINLRKSHSSMSSEKFEWIDVNEESNSFVLKKETADENLYLILNNSENEIEVSNPINGNAEKIKAFDYKIIFEKK